jgi:ABC-2 type transport system ATP-binding protein
MTADASVRIDRLRRVFGDVVAVDALTLDVAPGELFGIVGPDGSGKTTTLRMLAGILRPTSGRVHVAGVDVGVDPEGAKHRVAYMSQRFGLYGDLTVRESIDFYADLYGVPRGEREARIDRLYGFSRLGPFAARLAANLSGGMKQKLSLCCALVHRPTVLLLDEPTFGVDPISRRDLWLIVHEMVAEGMTTIVSTAYMDEAERCDRVALLQGGRLVGLDAPASLQARLAGRTVALDAERPRDAVSVLKASGAVRSVALFGRAVRATLRDGATAGGLSGLLADSGIAVRDARLVEPSLEDVFVELAMEAAHA